MEKSRSSASFGILFLRLYMVVLLFLGLSSCNKSNDPAPSDTTGNPTVASTYPGTNAVNIARNKSVYFTFNNEMDPTTITASTITLKQGSTVVAGAVTYSGKTATFNPTNDLSANLVYTAAINGAKDKAGKSLATHTFNFTTSADITSPLAVVNLGAAKEYVILAKTAINNNPISVIKGNMGVSPAATSYITGFALTAATGYATSSQVVGKIYGADMADPTPTNLTTAVENMITAYNDAAGRTTPDFSELGTGNLGGKTLIPGLYKWSNNVTVPTSITLIGDANDVWIFQVAGNLNMSSSVNITLAGGAQAKNIFWQVAGEVTIGTTAHFEGIVLSKTGITLGTKASMTGRALAQTAVILDGNAVTQPAD